MIIIDFVDVISIVLGLRGRMIEFLAWYFRPQVNSGGPAETCSNRRSGDRVKSDSGVKV